MGMQLMQPTGPNLIAREGGVPERTIKRASRLAGPGGQMGQAGFIMTVPGSDA